MNSAQDTGLPKIRISVLDRDIGYWPGIHKKGLEIFLDDERVLECITADEKLGTMIRLARDSKGKLIRGSVELSLEECKGDIRIEGLTDADRLQHYEYCASKVLVPAEMIYGTKAAANE